MPIHDKTINQRVVTATLIGPEINDLITKHVAQQAGIDLNENGVTARAYITSEMGSTGSIYTAKCEIVLDLDMQPRCAEQSE